MAFGTVFRNFNSALRAHGFIFRDGRRTLGFKCINKTGSAISANKLVAISGYDTTSKHMKIVLADADAANLATEVFVTRSSISNNALGTIYKGFLSTANLDTSSVTTVGDPVYLSTTAGAFTATAPATPASRVVIVGYVQVKSASVGQIAWDVQQAALLGTNDLQPGIVQISTGTISSADITGVGAGQFGHAQGYPLVATPGAGKALVLLNATASYRFSVAAYTGGGNTTVNIGSGGAALTGLISAANFAGAASDKPVTFPPLSTAGVALTANTSLNLVTASAFTQPGTAAGTINYTVAYVVVTL
jgi:hypothetical protein